MARVINPSLRIGTTDRSYVDVHVDYRLNFATNEAGFRYKEMFEFYGVDKAPGWIKKPIFEKTVDGEFVSQSGNMERSHRIRFARETLNEDRNGKDEVFCAITIIPVAPKFGGTTPELKYEFEEGKGRRNK